MLKATNLLGTFNSSGGAITSVTLTCSTASGAGPSATVVVKALTALLSPNQLIVSANALTGSGASNFVVTPPSNQTLTSTNTSVTYTISLAATPSVGCQGLTTTTSGPTFTFNHIQGTTTTPGSTVVLETTSMQVNSTVTGGVSGLSVSPATVNLSCVKSGSTYFPGPPQTITVSSTATGGTPFALDSGSPAASWLTYPVPLAGSNTATSGTPVTFTVQAGSACDSLPATGSNTATTTVSLQTTGLGSGVTVPDKTITVNLTVSGPAASSLTASPTAVTVTCAKSTGGAYTPNYPQTLSITSAVSGGTAFTVDTSVSPYASWLVVTPTSGGTATTSPVTLSLSAASGCGGFAVSTSTTTVIHLINAPAQDKLIAVTLQIVPSSILTAAPNPASLTYVKGSGTAGFANVNVTSTSSVAPFFTVNTATLPSWLRLNTTSGTTPQSLQFSSTSVADSLAPGTYSTTVVMSVSGYGDLSLPVSMLLTNKASQLTVEGPTTVTIPWTIGQGLPTATITALSTDTPIAYTATTGGTLAPSISANELSGLAYSFGTPINVTFAPLAFAAAQPGSVLTGTVTLTWGSPASTIVVTFDVDVQSPGATLTSLSPASLPVASSGTVYTVALTGTGFVPGTDPTQKTRVGIVTTPGTAMTFDTNISVNIVNQSNITLSIAVPSSTDAAIPFAGGTVNIGVCNPVGGTCTVATGQATLAIGSNPIIQAVTSSSSLLQASSVSVAPFDMISIFGANFCPNCTSNQVLTGSPNATTLTYAPALQFDSTHSLSITFQTHSGGTFIASAPILFATNTQINLMVPSAVTTGVPTDIIVNYGSGSFGSSTLKSSAAFTVGIVATDPGIFTIGADGQGSGAALDANYDLISATNPAGIRSGSGNSDIISIYMTGLGTPDSAGVNTASISDAGYIWSNDCLSLSSYLSAFNGAQTGTALTTLDGTLIIPSVLNTGYLVPCIASSDSTAVTIGGQTATVKYAGWVPGTIAGLYQINVELPDNTSGAFTTEAGLTGQSVMAPVQLPVTVTTANGSSQSGVSLWVAPRLLVSSPASNSLTGTVGLPWGVPNASTVTATQGTGTIHFAVTSGLLPPGVSLDPLLGTITGSPTANTAGSYIVTVTATDSANIPVTGKTTFTLTVNGGLFMTGTNPTASVFSFANSAVSTVAATGGVYPYTYSIAIASQSLPAGMAVNTATGVVSTTVATPAGTYHVTVSAVDSTSGTPLTGSISFDVVVSLDVVAGTVTAGSHSASSTIEAAPTTTGNTGTVTYTLDATTTGLSWVTFSTTTGVLGINSGAVVGTYPVTITAHDGTAPADATAAGTGTVTFNMVIN
jgi:uncharacterized protein (TIGR03437 family)